MLQFNQALSFKEISGVPPLQLGIFTTWSHAPIRNGAEDHCGVALTVSCLDLRGKSAELTVADGDQLGSRDLLVD
jgi:hypothetical protein